MAKSSSPATRDVLWRIEAAAFDVFTALVRLLPADVASALGAGLFRWLGPLTSAHATAERSLRLAYPEMDPSERRRLLAAQWENFGRYVLEFPLVDRLTPARGRVQVEGADRLARIAASGAPVVFISGHFSNLEIMAAVILEAGISCDITYRAANNPYVDERIKRSRRRYGVRLFAPKGGEGARDLIEALSTGRSIAIINDQKYDGGAPGVFFGREVRTNPAAARLALKFRTFIQPLSIQRTRGARFRVIAHEPIEVPRTGDRPADILAGVAAINAFIEARVRERPGEWWWLHRRWPREAYATLESAA